MATTEFDFERARYNMIEQQIRTWEVLDQDVLDLLFVVRREEFVPQQYRTLAFVDFEIPLPNGTRMWAPKMEARVLQSLALRASDRVLEIGTGSAYFTALLAEVSRHAALEVDLGGVGRLAQDHLEPQVTRGDGLDCAGRRLPEGDVTLRTQK